MGGSPTGSKTGRAIAQLIGEQMLRVKALSAPHDAAARAKERDAFLELVESRLAPMMGEVAQQVLNDPETPAHIRAMFEPVLNPTHQVDAILTILATGFGIFALSGAIMAPNIDYYSQRERARSPVKALSPEQAADGVVKGELTLEAGASEARQGGVDAVRFDHMVNTTGNPPGPGELLTLLRRGLISKERFDQGIRQGLSRSDWMGEFHSLERELLSASTAAEAVVQGHLSYADGAALAARWGITAADFDVMFQTAGAPLSRTELEELWNRGEVDQGTVEQALRESRLKPKYIPDALKLRRRIPPERSVVMMVARGVISHDVGVRKLLELGYDATDAAAFVAEASARKTAKHKEIAESEVLAAYTDGLIGGQQAADFLGRLGFTPDEAGFILAVTDHRRERSSTEAAITRVRSLYVGRKIERSVVASSLDHLRVPTEQRDRLIAVWDIEREATVKVLTLGELNAAAARGFIAHDDYVKHAGAIGYDPSDAEMLWRIAVTTANGQLRANLVSPGP